MNKKNILGELRQIKKISPVIICGAARSGTRMMTDVLNAHQNVVIQEEMHAKTLEAYLEMVSTINTTFDHYSDIKGYRLDKHWQSSKDILTQVFFATAGKKRVPEYKKDIHYHGIKTPGYERYFNEFEMLFNHRPPTYIYCMRSVEKVWRSWKSLDFVTDYELFETRYKRSLRQALRISKNASSRFILFDLDEYIQADDKAKHLENCIFTKMQLKTDSEFHQRLLNLENRNSIQKRGATYIKDAKVKREMNDLASNEKINEYKSMLVKVFSESYMSGGDYA